MNRAILSLQSSQLRHGQRLRRFALDYLATVARHEWPLGLLALVGVAPGVATLLAWSNLALALQDQRGAFLIGWLLPTGLLQRLGAEGVLVGAGMVTLLIGCLSLTNAYLASLERRSAEFALLRVLGLRRRDLLWLLALEALTIGFLASVVGTLLGLSLSWITWREAAHYLALPWRYQLSHTALFTAFGGGWFAVLLFLQTAAQLTSFFPQELRAATRPERHGVALRNSWLGTAYGAILALLVGLPILALNGAFLLALLAGVVGLLLNGSGWLLTRFYHRLPQTMRHPLWILTLQGLARHPNHTAGMTLAMTTGAYAVGVAAFSWLASAGIARFPFIIALLVLAAGATLVFTVAALAVLERRVEFSLLRALGARRQYLWQLVLLEYGMIAIGGGSIGASMALLTWATSSLGTREQWFVAIIVVGADLLGALASAWIGAAPVFAYLVRQRVQDGLHHTG